MIQRNKTARLAGALYGMLIICGIFSLMYVPSKLIDGNNPEKTVENIRQSEWLFRLGIVGGILMFLIFIFLPMTLYKLLQVVNQQHAKWMVLFALVSVPLSLANMFNYMSVLTLVGPSGYLQAMGPEQLQTQVMLHLNYYDNGVKIASIFWGLWLFPFGYLVYKSGFLPKVLGLLLMAGCIGYLVDFLGSFLFPAYSKTILSTIVHLPSSLGEFGICLWLLIMGTQSINKKHHQSGKQNQDEITVA